MRGSPDGRWAVPWTSFSGLLAPKLQGVHGNGSTPAADNWKGYDQASQARTAATDEVHCQNNEAGQRGLRYEYAISE